MAEPRSAPHLRDGVLLAAGALAAYIALWQTTLYQTDGHWILIRLAHGAARHNNHFLYMPLLMAVREVLAPLGFSSRHIALLLSSVGTAAGVGLAHAAARRLGLTRRQALWCTVLVAAAPPVVLFATVVELHGPFFAAAQLAFLAATALAQRPSPTRGVATGLATALAFGLHSSGLLLPALVLPWVLAVRLDHGRPLGARTWLACLIAGAVHLGGVLVLLVALQGLGFPEFPPAYDLGRAAALSQASLATVLEVLWQEWGRPYLPLSLLVLPALLARAVRARALASLAGGGAFLGLAVVLLAGRPGFGEYLLPLAMPAAVLVVETYRPWLVGLAVAATPVAALLAVLGHDVEGPRYRRFAAGVRAAAVDDRPFVLIADRHELGACLVSLPAARFHVLTREAVLPKVEVAPRAAALAQALLSEPWRRGEAVLLSRRSAEHLCDPARTPSGALILGALRASCRFVPVAEGTFDGWRLYPPDR